MKLLTPEQEVQIKEALLLFWKTNKFQNNKPVDSLSQEDVLKVQNAIKEIDFSERKNVLLIRDFPNSEEPPSCNQCKNTGYLENGELCQNHFKNWS